MHKFAYFDAMKLLRFILGFPSFVVECFCVLLRHNESTLAAFIRSRPYGHTCFIDTGVIVRNPRAFHAGIRTTLYHGTYILNSHGKFILGDDSHLGAFCYVNACYGTVTIGNHVAIGPGTKIFSYSNHHRANAFITDEKITADVLIGCNVLIGANCAILPGTRIPDNVVVAAGSVVKGELQSDSICAGVPCKVVRTGWFG